MKRRSFTKKVIRLLRQERRLSSLGYSFIAGVDEAGRGPLAGPVVAGAVILKDLDFASRNLSKSVVGFMRGFKEEIDDSKKLSAKKRSKAYQEIIEKAIVGVGIVDEKTIDEINIYRATIRAMELAISDLKVIPDYVLVDGRMKLSTRCPIKCIIDGDSKSLSIAAASIIAKVTRDNLMLEYDRHYPRYGFARHKGYGTLFHKLALKSHGPSPIHRYSFQPVKALSR